MANWLVSLILLYCPCLIAVTNAEGQALLELKEGLNESTELLGTWDPNLVEPCTSWSHITCSGGHVIAKTKPTQHSVRELRGLGLTPHLLACRSAQALEENVKDKLLQFCHVPAGYILNIYDVSFPTFGMFLSY
ncbi:uncharacterized protein LOC131876624 [Cryptomeria japonica]|uniref:uncharacterized protein LOC131876624 n=1 Tax=Cryptomeria japonica TaxID=3369 RepID=UPI0027DA0833|nr:uncharacterized protein LOC131876624 [Cryptomeria japonica]